MTPYSVAVRY